MQLLHLAPEIQQHLAALKDPGASWHFGYRPMGELARLPFEQQRIQFAAMLTQFESRRRVGAGVGVAQVYGGQVGKLGYAVGHRPYRNPGISTLCNTLSPYLLSDVWSVSDTELRVREA